MRLSHGKGSMRITKMPGGTLAENSLHDGAIFRLICTSIPVENSFFMGNEFRAALEMGATNALLIGQLVGKLILPNHSQAFRKDSKPSYQKWSELANLCITPIRRLNGSVTTDSANSILAFADKAQSKPRCFTSIASLNFTPTPIVNIRIVVPKARNGI